MKRLLLPLLLLFSALPLYGQGTALPIPPTLGPQGFPKAGATLSICNYLANALPCTNYASVFLDQGLTLSINQATTPITTDGLGNCCIVNGSLQVIWAAPGQYHYTVSGVGVAAPQGPYIVVAACFPGAQQCNNFTGLPNTPLAFTATPVFPASSSASYSMVLTGNVTSSTISGSPVNGILLSLTLVEDATGTHTFSFPPNFVFPVGYTFDTTALHTNALTFKFDGTNWNLISNSGTGGGGGGSPGNPLNCLQKNAGGSFGASNVCEVGSVLTVNDDTINCGANPWFDIRCFGAVAVNVNATPFLTGITCTINSGSPTCTLSAASTFVNGQGVAIVGAGPNNTPATPTGTTVVSSDPAGPWGSDYYAAGIGGGSETTFYRVAAMSKGGGISAASAEISVTGQTRGSATTNLSSCVRPAVYPGYQVNCTTSSAHTIAVGDWVFPHQTTNDPEYAGYHIVTAVPDNTHFSFNWNRTYLAGATTIAATGGIVQYGHANVLALAGQAPPAGVWQYCIYSSATSNAETFRDVSMVVTPGVNLDSSYMLWGDFGTSYTTVPTISGVSCPTNYPTVATSDLLVTTICSGAGSTTLTLCGNASTSVTNAAIVTDNTPNYRATFAAAAAAHAPVVVPAMSSGQFGTNSVLDISSFSSTPLYLSDASYFSGTLVTAGNVVLGKTNNVQGTQFSLENLTNIGFAAKPGMYTTGGTYRGLAFNPVGTNTQGVFIAPGPIPTGVFEDVAFLGASASGDFQSVPLRIFAQGQAGSAAAGLIFRNIFIKRIAQGLTSCIISKNYGELNFENVMEGGCGVAFLNCPTCTIIGATWNQGLENQGPVMPMFVTRGTVGLGLSGAIEDTGSQPEVSHLGQGPLFVSGIGTTPSGGIPSVTGFNIQQVGMSVSDAQSGVNTNYTTGLVGLIYDGVYNTNQSMQRWNTHFGLGPNYSWFTVNSTNLPAPTCTVTTNTPASIGGSPNNYVYVPVYANGGFGLPSAGVNCSTDGVTQQATLTFSPVLGATAYKVFFGFGAGNGLGNAFTATFPYLGTATVSILIPASPFQGQSAPQFPGGGPVSIQNSTVAGVTVQGSTIAIPTQMSAPAATLGVQLFDVGTDNWPAFNVNNSATKYFAVGLPSTVTWAANQCLQSTGAVNIFTLSICGFPPGGATNAVQFNCGSNTFCGVLGVITGQSLIAQNGAAPVFASPGVPDGNAGAHVTTTPYAVACDSATTILDRATTLVFDSGSSVVNLWNPAGSGCGSNLVVTLINNSGGNLTVNRGGSAVIDVNGISGGPLSSQTSFTLPNNTSVTINNGEGTRYNARLASSTTSAGTSAISVQNSDTCSTTCTSGNLACRVATNGVGNCTSFPPVNFIGVFFNNSGGYQVAGQMSVNLDATVNVTNGQILCASSASDTAHNNSSTACANGGWIGIVRTTASSVAVATVDLELR